VSTISVSIASNAMRRGVVVLGLATLVAHLLYLAPLPVAWRGLAALFLLTLPGALLAYLLFRAEADALSLGFLALCGGLAHQVLLLLALHALPGPLSWWLVLLAFDALSLLLGWLAILRPPAASIAMPPAQLAIPLTLILLLAAGLRLLFLGGAEVQGDEARALLRGEPIVRPEADEPPKSSGRRGSVPSTGAGKDRPEGGLRPEPQPGS